MMTSLVNSSSGGWFTTAASAAFQLKEEIVPAPRMLHCFMNLLLDKS
jgi:hypothetical protein